MPDDMDQAIKRRYIAQKKTETTTSPTIQKIEEKPKTIETEKPISKFSPSVMEKSEQVILSSPQFRTNIGFRRELEAKKQIRDVYMRTGELPENLTSQVIVPSEYKKIGASQEYKRYVINKYLGMQTKKEETGIESKMRSSYWYMSTQPVFSIGKDTSKKTFSQLKKTEPALYLKMSEKGFYESQLDVKRWYTSKWEQFGTMEKIGLSVSSAVLNVFDYDYWFAKDRQLYSYTKFYQTSQALAKGSNIGIEWVKPQIPAYENVILPLAGGYGFGRIATSVKLGGGLISGTSKLVTKAAYVGLVSTSSVLVVKSGYDIGSSFQKGETREGFKRLTQLGGMFILGAAGYKAGSKAAVLSYKTKSPNIELYSEPVPVKGEKYIKFMRKKTTTTIKGEEIPIKTIASETIYQKFVPGKKIISKSVGTPTRTKFVTTMGSSATKRLMVGMGEGTTKMFKTKLGSKYSFGYRTVWGVEQKPSIGLENISTRMVKGTFKESTLMKYDANRYLRSLKSNLAVQPVMPKIRTSFLDKIQIGESMLKPSFIYKGETGLIGIGISKNIMTSSYKPPVISFKPSIQETRFKPVLSNVFVSFNKQSFIPKSDFSFAFKPVLLQIPDVSSIVKPKISQRSFSDIVSIPEFDYPYRRTGYDLGKVGFPPLGLGGKQGYGFDFEKYLRGRYRYREFKIPSLWKVKF